MNKESILITGSDGMLGSYLNFGIRMNKNDLDITNLQAVMAKCMESRPSIILHLAALTNLSECEKEPSRAYLVNTVGTYNMALAARTIGAKLVFISTSGVFDGAKEGQYNEADVPNPVNVYGHSKYLAELAVAAMLEDFLIVRTSWVFGGGKEKDKKFVGKMVAQCGAAEVRAVTDRSGSPTYAKDLAWAILQLLKEERRGIVHLGGGVATRYEVAREVFTLLGSHSKVVASTSGDFVGDYKSGRNESMPISEFMRPWREALAEYLLHDWDEVSTFSEGSKSSL